MRRKMVRLLLALLVVARFGYSVDAAEETVRVGELRCEYLVDPLGIDVVHPRLSWKIEAIDSTARDLGQSAFQVLVASSATILETDRGDVWDTGRLASDQSTHVVYAGKPLGSNALCFWKVRVWDQQGHGSAWSTPAKWSIGPLRPEDWKASWIGAPVDATAARLDPWFRKNFTLSARPVRAWAHVAALGYYEFYINGKKADDRVLAPCISDFSQRARYATYDISECLHEGDNVAAVWAAPGWADHEPFKVEHKPLVIAQIEVQLADGSALQVVTDESWKTHSSPLTPTIANWGKAGYGGERYDARLEVAGWNSTELHDTAWESTAVFTPPVKLSAEMVEPNRRLETLHPVEIQPIGPGVCRVDMGRSYAGWFEIRLKGKPGKTVTLEFSERPEETKTYGQVSEYVFGATGEGVFCHRFNYAAGRWITIKGLEATPRSEDIRGYLISTASPRASRFECSNPLVNRLYDTMIWTYRSLSLGGYLVDCPHRERFGYGDGASAMEAALKNFDVGAFATKWLMDWRDLQRPDGESFYSAPTYGGAGGPAWCGICVTLPWQLYLHLGDRRILEVSYPSMQRWISYLDARAKNDLLQPWGGPWEFLGDWVPPGRSQDPDKRVDNRSTLFFNNCYYMDNMATVSKAAEILGKTKEADLYRTKAAAIGKAAHEEFFQPEDHSYANGEQPYEALPLLVGLTPPPLRPGVMKRLEDEILVNKNGHIDAGIYGTYFLLKLLTEQNRNDLVFTMANQRTYPGWGHMLEQGATTFWEQWDGENSRVHSSFLSIGSWFIEGIAGIRLDPAQPGYKHFLVRPGIVGDLTWAKCEYESPYGRIVSEWKIANDCLTLIVEVPVNTTATVFVPTSDPAAVTENGQPASKRPGIHSVKAVAETLICEIGSGCYEFRTSDRPRTTDSRDASSGRP